MTCDDVVQLVEAIAAGDLAVGDEVRAHVESCPHCAAALASAYRLEAALAAWPQPPAPDAFTRAVVARVRNERWTSEQRIDRMFNAAIVFALLVAVAGIAALTNIGILLAGADWLIGVTTAATTQMAKQAAPVMATYIAAAGVLVSALLMWWWAERRLTL